MPQHTSTRQSPGKAGVAQEELRPPDTAGTGDRGTGEGKGSERAADAVPAAKSGSDATEGEATSAGAAPAEDVQPEATPEPASAQPVSEPDPAPTEEPHADTGPAEPEPDATSAEPVPAEEPPPGPVSTTPEPAPTSAQPVSEPDPAPTEEPHADTEPAEPEERGRWTRRPGAARVIRLTATLLAALLVHVCLQVPNTVGDLKPVQFMRLPAEAVMGAVVLLSLPRRSRIVVSVFAGALLGAVTLLNLMDMGFTEYLGRPFNVVLDWSLLDDAQSYLKDSLGGTAALGITVGAVALVVLLLGLVALATVRLGNLLARHRALASRATLVVGTVWITCAALNLQAGGIPIASQHTAGALKTQAQTIRDTLRDEAAFAKEARKDAFGGTPADQLVPDLRGKDVIFTFIESYGRSAIEDPIMAPGVDRTLGASTQTLARAGYHARSGWLTSSTYGGGSWFGHSTTMSGLWIDNQQRYGTVMTSDHLSLTKAFQKTGAWDTVGIMPGIQKAWPEQKYYGLDRVHNAFQLGYQGPKFSWSTMPDQYALEAFQRLEHGKKRDKPLMAEVVLTSSHQPWAPIPEMVGWDELGDGSVFGPVQKAGHKVSEVYNDTTKSREEYGKSIQYSVTALTQWLERYGTDDTVLVFLGDHQPIAKVSGTHASRDVPISIVAKDPKVLDKIAGWNWTDGLKPAHNAPVWKMSSFRDRFLTAYGSTPHPSKG